MGYLNESQLARLNLKKLGKNVLISEKASINGGHEISIGDNSRIDDFCVLSGKIEIGRNVHIAVFCNIAGGEEGIELRDFSGLAYSCNIFSQSDDYTGLTLTNPTVPDKYKKEIKKAVCIGRHCILGTGSIVFPGVNMADGCSLGAKSLLTADTEEWGIYAGIPARRIKDRAKKLLDLERKYLSEG